jgi:hypothetical protein
MTADDPVDDPGPDLGDAGGALREQWRAEEEEYGRAAAAQWAHGRRLVDIARELMHRGDTVAVSTGEATFTGQVTQVGADLVQLGTPAGRVDLHLAALTTGAGDSRRARLLAPVVVRVVERARAGGRRSGATSETFRARLLEYEAEAAEVVVGSVLLSEQLRGALTVGRDQLRVCDPAGRETYLPIAWVSWVMPWRE